MSFGNYWENKILDHIFGKDPYTAPAHIYVGLSLTDPGEDGSTVSEPTHESYGRVETDPSDWTVASGGVIKNAVDIVFNVPTGDWGTISHGIFFDAASGGNFLAYGNLPVPVEVLAGPDAPLFSAGEISIFHN